MCIKVAVKPSSSSLSLLTHSSSLKSPTTEMAKEDHHDSDTSDESSSTDDSDSDSSSTSDATSDATSSTSSSTTSSSLDEEARELARTTPYTGPVDFRAPDVSGLPFASLKWNMSFSGCGFLGIYHLGVVQTLTQHGRKLLMNVHRFGGASAGSLIAAALATRKLDHHMIKVNWSGMRGRMRNRLPSVSICPSYFGFQVR